MLNGWFVWDVREGVIHLLPYLLGINPKVLQHAWGNAIGLLH
jgi:hypothetical protein